MSNSLESVDVRPLTDLSDVRRVSMSAASDRNVLIKSSHAARQTTVDCGPLIYTLGPGWAGSLVPSEATRW